MKIQVQPNRWSCIPTAFAIVLDANVQDIISEIGHDGSEIWWPRAQFPSDRRGFHLQELIDCCLRRSFALTTIEPRPVLFSPEQGESKEVNLPVNTDVRLERLMRDRIGVLTGLASSGSRHAVAWYKDRIIDPAVGREIPISIFSIQYFHLISKVDFGLDAK